MPEPIQAGLWGALAASALMLGAVAALTLPGPPHPPARVLAGTRCGELSSNDD
jgi:hypothetical protein